MPQFGGENKNNKMWLKNYYLYTISKEIKFKIVDLNENLFISLNFIFILATHISRMYKIDL